MITIVLLLLQVTKYFTGVEGFLQWKKARLETKLLQYVQPEKDPEYKDSIKKSLLAPFEDSEKLEVVLPYPRDGDVVSYTGKWGVEELALGRIRDLIFREDKGEWFAEVLPLVEGKSNDVYVFDPYAGSIEILEVKNLKPVRSFFVRAENGYKVAFRGNSTIEVIYKAPSYRGIDDTFVVPKKQIDTEALAKDLALYSQLKERVIRNALAFGSVGFVGTSALFGFDTSVPYLCGAFAGAGYLYLLGKKTDTIGSGYSSSRRSDSAVENTAKTKAEEALVRARLALPALTMALLVAYKTQIDPKIGGFMTSTNGLDSTTPIVFQAFKSTPGSLSKHEFLGAAAGFLTYMVALIITEVGKEVRADDVLSLLPGSVAESFRMAKRNEQNSDDIVADEKLNLTSVAVITGPRAAGRDSIVSNLLAMDEQGQNSKYQSVKFLTTDSAQWQTNPRKYSLVDRAELSDLQQSGDIIYEGEEKGSFGTLVPIYLTKNALERPGKDGSIAVLECEPTVLEALLRISDLKLVNIWISLQTKEQFIEKATELVEKDLSVMKREGKIDLGSAKKASEEVADLVNDAARDVGYFMQKAPIFEYTLLNSGAESEIVEELDLLLKNSM